MKKLPIFIILLLTGLWFYICWYWYTCNMKDFCNPKDASMVDISQTQSGDISLLEPISSSTLREDEPPITADIVDTQIDTTQTGTIVSEESSPNASLVKVTCDDIITKAISLGANNDPEQVQVLENFLNTQGESLDIDGRYSQDDYEAVKRFQLSYKADILDPAGITRPTGYVYNNTMKKINQIHCQ